MQNFMVNSMATLEHVLKKPLQDISVKLKALPYTTEEADSED
jgi:hypothetical protein